MRRRLLIVLLAVGTFVGFGSGFAHVAHRLGCQHFSHPCGGDWERPSAAAPAP